MDGGLGVKHLDFFNLSLLGKWRWRILVDNEACWFEILQSRYGVLNFDHDMPSWNSKNSSQWWRDLCALDRDKFVPPLWFTKEVRRKVGNGAGTYFWHDDWFGNQPLKEAFPRLFSSSSDKLRKI